MVFAAALALYGMRRRQRVGAFIILVHWFLNPSESSDWLLYIVSQHRVKLKYTNSLTR